MSLVRRSFDVIWHSLLDRMGYFLPILGTESDETANKARPQLELSLQDKGGVRCRHQ